MHWKKSSRRRKEGSAVSELEYVGKRYVREDAYDKARGKNRYTCDRKLTGMLFAKLVLSEKAQCAYPKGKSAERTGNQGCIHI